jgi:hypothetical protein
VAAEMTRAPATATTTSQVQKERKRNTNNSYKAAALRLVHSGEPLEKSKIDGASFYELWAYLTEMKKEDSKVRIGSDLQLRRKHALEFYDRNGTESWKFQKQESDM